MNNMYGHWKKKKVKIMSFLLEGVIKLFFYINQIIITNGNSKINFLLLIQDIFGV
jgi:hypothetical protein